MIVLLFKMILRHILLSMANQDVCKKAVEKDPPMLRHVPDDLKTQEMCNEALEKDPWLLKDVPNHFKTQLMCDDAVRYYPYSLEHVPDWFVTQQPIDRWYDNNYVHNDEVLSKWYEGYKKRRAQKAKIKEKLLSIAWHPDRVKDWCMSEDEKRWWKQ